ncbi:MAG: DUF1653 domain-containing protein [Patescibacteria group bacterium]|jgi:hypothetical protein
MSDIKLSDQAKGLKLGIYEHYKGGRYRVIGVAFHSETLQEMVIYQAQYGEHNYWARPLDEFFDEVEYLGRRSPRFKYVEENK